MASTPIDFSKKSLVIVSGASQGIGQTIAANIAKVLGDNSVIVLVARSLTGLETTKNLVLQANPKVGVKVHSLDLSKPTIEELENLFNLNLDFELAVIFHNIGHIGTVAKTTELTNIQTWRDYYDVNVFSVGILNSVFCKKLRDVVPRLVVVNITSLIARKPAADMVLYGSGKAARQIYFCVFALEEPDITVLNYSPGPVDTSMFQYVLDNVKDEESKARFSKMKEDKFVLTTDQTVSKMLQILKEGTFKTGDVVDYFDRIESD